MIYKKIYKIISLLFMLLLMPMVLVAANGGDKKGDNLKKTLGEPSYKKFNINQISTFIKNDGESDINPNGNSGFEYPKNSGKQAIFQSGFLWGGKVDGQVRVGGSVYRQGTVPGKVLNSGVSWDQLQAESPGASNVRNYRVRPDYKDGNVQAEINDGEGSESDIRAAYERDWMEWPAADGAPYDDIDGNGSYDPNIDIPGVPGAAQTIWFVCNDTDKDQTLFMYGSLPMGIEEQVTVWGYNLAGPLGSMLFRKYKIINKSDKPFEDMYVSMWNDPDLGSATDDFVGCDTVLSMTYVYNANPTDGTYGSQPAAAGFDFFQGPMVQGTPEDTAIFNNQYVIGKKNLPMTAHYFFINSDPIYKDPTQGQYTTGTLEWYQLLQGRVGSTGEVFPNPLGGESVFALSGDPVTGEGWIDGLSFPPGDRRAGMASGPFNMAPQDTQEIVVAEIAAIGANNINSVAKLKDFDRVAQDAYEKFFVLPSAPRTPLVEAVPMDKQILLNWGLDKDRIKETESHNVEGYKFEGYNIYQLPSPSAIDEAKRIATFDVINGVKVIIDKVVDPETGQEVTAVQQYGNDTGLKHHFLITKDYLTNQELNNGSRYYFAVTAYAYTDDPRVVPNNLENPIASFTVIPHSLDPGERVASSVADNVEGIIQSSGLADATVKVTVVDPSKLTGHKYQVFFNQQHYYLDANNVWQKTNFADSIGKVRDVSPSTLEPAAVYGITEGTIDLNLILNLDSPTDSWVDGIKLTFPAGVEIVSAPVVHAGGDDVTPLIEGNVITYGLINGDTTQNGVFHGGEALTVVLKQFTPPLSVDYIIYDDGYPDPNAPMNAVGTATVNEIGNYFVTQYQWNVRDLTTDQVVLEDQTVLSGQDIYAPSYYSTVNPLGIEGPGGSTGNYYASVGPEAAQIVDGLLFEVNGSYDPPIVPNSYEAADSVNITTGSSSSKTYTVFNDYTLYGLPTSHATDAFGFGTENIDTLQQDYEIRYTGILDTTVTGTDTLIIVREGTGSMATIFSTVGGAPGLADHPLNPNPGTAAPFLIRIPYEVWNVDEGKQVNVMFRDREQSLTANPFYAWNPNARNYVVIVNTDYDPNTVIPQSEHATWVVVFYSTRLKLGETVTISYANPLQLGVDTFTFDAPAASTYSAEAAKDDVKKINVFPNPYYGVNSQEINKYQRFVTFNHLPNNATIRIFNLAGQLVRTIVKSSADQNEKWDLLTESGLPVASGLYIVYIDMPDLGTTKVLKAAIIQEQQILDRF